ncbi:unnamed protein product [Bathycoccus prasinos]
MRASDFSSSLESETDSSLVSDADAAVLRELVNAYFFFPRKCLTTIKTQQEDLERDVCDDGEGALFSSFAYSEDESEEDLRTTVDEELRLFREKWSTVFAAEEKEEDKEEEEEEMLERDHHLVCDERTKRSFIKRTDEEDGVKNEECGTVDATAADEGTTGKCDDQQSLASDELSALGAIVRKEREERVKREVMSALRKNERELEYVRAKARNDAQRVIAKHARIWFYRRTDASLTMQRHARGFLARVRLKHKTTMVVRIQRRWKFVLFVRLRTDACVIVQTAFRAHISRKKLEKEKMENAAATRIQTHVKRLIAMRRYAILERKIRTVQACAARWIRKRKRASQIIQKSFRSYVETKRLGKYATRVQAAFRGYRVRRRFAAILDSSAYGADDDVLPTLSEYDSDTENNAFVDKNDDKENEIEMISDDAFYFARLSAPLPRNADNARHDELHADILALRTKRIRDQNMQTKMNEANLRSLYETRFKKNAQNRKEFRRVRALRMT